MFKRRKRRGIKKGGKFDFRPERNYIGIDERRRSVFETGADLFTIRSPDFFLFPLSREIPHRHVYRPPQLAKLHFNPRTISSLPLSTIILIMSSRTFCQQYRETYRMRRLRPLSDLTSQCGINAHLANLLSPLFYSSELGVLFVSSFRAQKSDRRRVTCSLKISSIPISVRCTARILYLLLLLASD